MTATRSSRAVRSGLAIAILAGVLAVLQPWTVVPIETTNPPTFNADDYIESIWHARVVPTARTSAVDLQAFMQKTALGGRAPGPPGRAAFVKGTATVVEIDRGSRVGLARLRLAWAPRGHTVAIQIGPVVRGTALRDALDFIRFTDFVNQLEFATVANALNERVLTDVLGPANVDGLAGREVAFVGAVPASEAGSALQIVPVELQVVGEVP